MSDPNEHTRNLSARIQRVRDDVRVAMANDVPAELSRVNRFALGAMLLSGQPKPRRSVEFTANDDTFCAWNAAPDTMTCRALLMMGWNAPSVDDNDQGTPAEAWRFFV